MSDEIDQAQTINEQFQAGVLAEHVRHRLAGVSRETCLDCGEPIPEARRQAVPGCQRCVACQTLQENWRPM